MDAGGGRDGKAAIAQLRACMESLRQRLRNIAGEADTFAAQQKADLARSKRSLSQACRLPLGVHKFIFLSQDWLLLSAF